MLYPGEVDKGAAFMGADNKDAELAAWLEAELLEVFPGKKICTGGRGSQLQAMVI